MNGMIEHEKVNRFLGDMGMSHHQLELEELCSRFIEEMKAGLRNEESGLQMIPTYIQVETSVPFGRPVIAIDAGGTNLRVGAVHFDEGQGPVVENYVRHDMPGTRGEVGKQRFFEQIADYLEPVLEYSLDIGFCFSYPTEIFPDKDGRVIKFSKEVRAEEVKGELLGRNLNQVLKSRGRGEKNVVVLNDTVATLLGGRAAAGTREYDSYIGFILGTGTNCCYIERNGNIRKANGHADPAGTMIVNIESGGFARAPQGELDREFDSSTVNPGDYTFEKMISGVYLGPLCLATLKRAARAGLFSSEAGRAVQSLDELDTKQAGDYLEAVLQGSPVDGEAGRHDGASSSSCTLGSGVELTGDDARVAAAVIDALAQRAALLSAANISSAALKTPAAGSDPERPLCITAEGSVFYGFYSLRDRIERYLDEFLRAGRGCHFQLLQVERATLVGTAVAGLTN
jgi:hexokinase